MMKDQTIESMILSWVRKAEQNGELSQNQYCGKAIDPRCGCKVHTQQRHHAINTMASTQTAYKQHA